MAVGDEHSYGDGRMYVETVSGPMVWFHCEDCGKPAAVCLEYTGKVRCSGCWPMFHGLAVRGNVGDAGSRS